MVTSTDSQGQSPVRVEVPQYGLGAILIMFVWPAAWYTLLIYVIGRLLVPNSGATPTWILLLFMVLGSGAELVAGLVLLRREGYRMSPDALRDRIRLHWPKGWRAWLLAVIVLVLGVSLSILAAIGVG
jgi:hypothetical protein